MSSLKDNDLIDHRGRFIVVGVENPAGFRPGRYYYVMHMATGRKVSRYLRRIGSADRKAENYAHWFAAGDRYWPEVTRDDELRTNPDVVPTFYEKATMYFTAWGLSTEYL